MERKPVHVSWSDRIEETFFVETENYQAWLEHEAGLSVCTACNKKRIGLHNQWVGCDKCDQWFHTRCVGLNDKTIPDGDWFCSFCKLPPKASKKRKFESESNKNKKKIKLTQNVINSLTCSATLAYSLRNSTGYLNSILRRK